MNPIELHQQRETLKAQKALLTQQVMSTKDRMHGNGRLPNHMFQELHMKLSSLKRQMSDVDAQISAINTQLHVQAQNNTPSQVAADPGGKKPVIEMLSVLRKHYQDFAADTTRVRSKRDMAAEFVVKLSDIIRTSISAK